jgi:hypothetical protein
MKISNSQIKKIIREEMSQFRPRKSRSYNAMSDSGKALAGRAKRMISKDYPDIKVGISAREGWITVDGKKAVNLSSASGSPMSLDVVIDKMKKAYLGHSMPEGHKMKITKRQLKRLIREEKTKVLQEYGAMSKESLNPTIAFAQAWSGLGDAIQEQMIDLVNAHVEGRLEDAIYEINPYAFERAQERLATPLRMMDGEDADELQDMMEQVSQLIRSME